MTAPQVPWQLTAWEDVLERDRLERIAHALLIRGPAGVGKRAFADHLARFLLCEASDRESRPCGACRGCKLNAAGSHPDRFDLGVEEKRTTIGVEQIRTLIEQLGLTAGANGYKVAMVAPADLMSHAAANTLLKTLEEPPGATVVILVSSRSLLLPATVRSRCQTITIGLPPPAQALEWLESLIAPPASAAALLAIAEGAPFEALALAETGGIAERDAVLGGLRDLLRRDIGPMEAATRWQEVGAYGVLRWLRSAAQDLVRMRQGGGHARLVHADRASGLHDLSQALDLGATFQLLDLCTEMARALGGQVRLNEGLLLEALAIRLEGGTRRGRTQTGDPVPDHS